jgi:hypothetical protein
MKRPDKTWTITIGVMCAVVIIGILFTCNAQANGRGHHNDAQGTSTNLNANANLNSNQSTNQSTAFAGANAQSGSTSNSGGNTLRAGDVRSDTRISTSNNAGSVDATGGEVDSDITDNSVTTTNTDNSNDVDIPAASAASIMSVVCMEGSSGQVKGGGFAISSSSEFCDFLRMADVHYAAYERAKSTCSCVGVCTTLIASIDMVCEDEEQAKYHYGLYLENIDKAQALVDNSGATSNVERNTGNMITFVGIIALLAKFVI